MNLYTYVENNPLIYVDPTGNYVETIFDVLSIGNSAVDMWNEPSWGNAGYLAWDVTSAFVPFVPGSYTAKATSKAAKLVNKEFSGKVFEAAKVATAGKVVQSTKVTKGTRNVSKQTVKTNLGNKINVKPYKNHTTTTKNPGPYGSPNSSIDIIDPKTGNINTRRWYDSNGRAYRDVDYSNHGNPRTHPEAPHEHFWKYDKNGKVIGR